MKEEALALANGVSSPAGKLNILREYLQACVLRSLHESEAFLCLSFVGGTALRFLFNLPRFSEDLDFSLESPAGYDPVKWMGKLKRDLSMAGFDPAIRWNDRKTVHVAWIRFPGILRAAGLADMEDQKLSIKLEVDTRPPKGAVLQVGVVNRHLLFSLRYHDLPSLMAGKIHALITRAYPKGRDWFDLLWYCAKRPPVEPNEVLLQNALDQTAAEHLAASRWRDAVRTRLLKLNEQALREDVESFLERPQDADLLVRDNLLSVLKT